MAGADRGYRIGVEREGLRIDEEGRISLTSHPDEFGDRLKNFWVSTDFGEAMLELRTDPRPDTKACYQDLLKITREVLGVLKGRGEYLWPYSMPCTIPNENRFRFNSYPGHPEEEEHERVLAGIYGIRRLCISGIHFNFSVHDEMHAFLCERYPSVPRDKEEAYMRCCRNLFRVEPLIRHFLDASPTDLEGNLTGENSFRNSPLGYRCEAAKTLDFRSKRAYAESLSRLARHERIGPVLIKSAGERYAGIMTRGIERIELRLCDINPFDICGVSVQDLDFMTAVLFLCLCEEADLDTPRSLLRACEQVSRELSLGVEDGIRAFVLLGESGQTRSDQVRDFLGRFGTQGLCQLAKKYVRTALEGEEP